MESHPTKIVIADTNPKILSLLEEKFSKSGYQVELAQTAKDAVIASMLNTPDVIIASYTLPDADGLAFVNMMGNSSGEEAVPVIFLVASDTSGVDFPAGRIIELVKKPYLFDELAKKVEDILDMIKKQKKSASKSTVFGKKKKGFALLDIIQVLAANRKNSTIELRKKHATGKIYLRQGKITNASMQESDSEQLQEGEDILYELFRWNSVNFFIADNTDLESEPVIVKSVHDLITEALERLEE